MRASTSRRGCATPRLVLLTAAALAALSALGSAVAEPQKCEGKAGQSAGNAKCTNIIDDSIMNRAVCSSHNFQDIPPMNNPEKFSDIRLENNCIKNLHDNSFQKYTNLRSVNLERNVLEHISDGAFLMLKNLQRLDISKNYLRIRNNNFLQPLTKLRVLRMGNIQVILDDGFFKPQKETLEVLDLHGTSELTIKEGAFSGLHQLTSLNLSNCNLKTLDNTGLMVKDFDGMPLRALNLGDNPWECDCRLRWLPEWYKKKQLENGKIQFSNSPTCAGPVENTEIKYKGLRGVKLFDVATLVTKFQCKPEVYASFSKTDHKMNEGDNVTMICKFFSDPKGQTVWLFGENTPSTKLPMQAPYHQSQTKGEINFEAQLTISNLKVKDQGVYMCAISNERGSASLRHQVLVDASKSAMGTKRMVIIVSIGAVIVITCTLMIGGVFFYHYTRSSPRSGGSGGGGIGGGGGGSRKAPPSYAQQASYSQLQSRTGSGGGPGSGENGYSSGAATLDGKRQQNRHQQHHSLAEAQQAAIPLTAELPYDSADMGGTQLPPGYMSIRSPVNRTATLPAANEQHQHGPGECPVHGSRQFGLASSAVQPCPLHGHDVTSRSGTPQQQQQHLQQLQHHHVPHHHGTLPGAAAKPCPLHGDLYATIAKAAPQPHASPPNPPLPPPVDPALLRQRMLQQQQQQQQQQQLPASSVGSPPGTYVRASKVDDCIPTEAAGVAAAAVMDLPPPPAQLLAAQQPPIGPPIHDFLAGAGVPRGGVGAGPKPNPQDDEGYSTAV